jgi:hypothetical protein
MTPAEELRAAATKLRETAAKATPGSWTAREHSSDIFADSSDFEWVAEALIPHEPAISRGNAAWIALMSPVIAEPIARVLDEAADLYTWTLERTSPELREELEPRIRQNTIEGELAVARQINGSGS